METNCKRNSTCNFAYISDLSDDNKLKCELLREMFSHLEQMLRSNLSCSRETALCYTKLEEALMWGIKGICLDDVASRNINGEEIEQSPCA